VQTIVFELSARSLTIRLERLSQVRALAFRSLNADQGRTQWIRLRRVQSDEISLALATSPPRLRELRPRLLRLRSIPMCLMQNINSKRQEKALRGGGEATSLATAVPRL
jgi:hypothetical protein